MNTYRKYKILLVDDNVTFLKALRMQIKEVLSERIDYIEEAHNGLEAIELMQDRFFNIVFMDIDMPQMNGIEATTYINQHFPHVMVVALTMHNDFQFIEKMLVAGSRTYITKDNLDDKEILKAIENIGKYVI